MKHTVTKVEPPAGVGIRAGEARMLVKATRTESVNLGANTLLRVMSFIRVSDGPILATIQVARTGRRYRVPADRLQANSIPHEQEAQA